MTLYVIKHANDDYKLYSENGTVLFEFDSDMMTSDGPERDLVEEFVSSNPGVDLLANDDVRPHFIDIVTNNWGYRDMTIESETVPWD